MNHAGGVGSSAARYRVMTSRASERKVDAMPKKRQRNWKSLDWLLKRLKAQAKKIVITKEVVPPEIADDPRAILEWMRDAHKRQRRTRKWDR